MPALETINLAGNPLGDEGLAALVAPPPPPPGSPPPPPPEEEAPSAVALPPPTGVLAELKTLYLSNTQITDPGCAALAAALDRGALPALMEVELWDVPASFAARDTVHEALTKS